MKVVLPEKRSLKTKDWIIYGVIIAICIISIVIAFYEQFLSDIFKDKEGDLGQKNEEQVDRLKAEFENMFTNSIDISGDVSSYKLKDSSKEIVYLAADESRNKVNSYDIKVHIPQINIDNSKVDEFNGDIIDTYVEKAKEILKTKNKNTIYTVEYVANVQDDILSLMIRSTLKEGSNAQRVNIKTYNYDLKNNKELTLEDIIKLENLEKNDVQSRIDNEIKSEQKKAEELIKLGYKKYSRDLDSDLYKIENTTEVYLTKRSLYIIYAYGNKNINTNDMDIVVL